MLTILKLMASKNLSSSMCVFCVTERVCVCNFALHILPLIDGFAWQFQCFRPLCIHNLYSRCYNFVVVFYFISFYPSSSWCSCSFDVNHMWMCFSLSRSLSLHACAVLASPNSVFNRSFLFFLFCCCFHFDWFCYRIFGIQSILRFELFFVSPSSRSLTRFLQAFSV